MQTAVPQYTLRQVPVEVDQALRRWADRNGLSLNQAAIQVLRVGLGLEASPVDHRDLDEFCGCWQAADSAGAPRRPEPEMDELLDAAIWK